MRLPDNRINRAVDGVDGWQRRFGPVAFVYAVIKKFGDDRCGQFAALLSYYGFFSLFPLLLVMVAVLGLVLQSSPGLQQDLVDSAVSNFPVVGDQIAESVGQPTGSVLAVAIAIVLALWAGLGATQVAQDALNAAFGVPVLKRKNFWIRQLRGLLTLAVFGTAVLVITGLGSVSAWLGPSTVLARAGLLVGTVALDTALVAALFRVLVHRRLSWRKAWPGAVFGGVTWTLLQYLGSFYVQRSVAGASRTYGLFAVVIGLLSWIYLQAQLFLYAAQVSSVAANRLWPRSIVREYPTAADIAVADLIEDREQRVKESEREWREEHRRRANQGG
jgi:YihY family inner membrane protein